METRANYTLIGAFTLAVVAAGFLFVWWFTGGGKAQDRKTYQVIFNGSVSGLSRGASVLFNGLRVGEVTLIDLRPEDPSQVYAMIDVSKRTPVKMDTTARLEMGGLTGVASIALAGGGVSAADRVSYDVDPKQGVIYAERSDFQNLLENVQNLTAKADSVLAKADTLFAEGSGSVKQSLDNVQRFTKALADNTDGMDAFLKGVGDLGQKIGPLAGKLEVLTADLDKIVRAVDPEKVGLIVADVREITGAVAKNKDQIDTAMREFGETARKLPEIADRISQVATLASGTLTSFDGKQIADIVGKASAFMTTVDSNRGSIDTALKDVADITSKLSKSADRIDGVLASAQSFLGDPGTGDKAGGMMKDISDAAKSMRVLADNLDKRTREITTGINRFTGPVAREYEALAVEGRRAIGEIGRAARSLDKNPSQLIFGGKSAIPDYAPSR